MISLAASSTTTRISPEPGDGRTAGDTAPADGGFSALLAQHAPQEVALKCVGATDDIGPVSEIAPAAPASVKLPVAATGGKELPALPVAVAVLPPVVAGGHNTEEDVGDSPVETATTAETSAAIETSLAAMVAPQACIPGARLNVQAEELARLDSTMPERPVASRPAPAAQIPAPIVGEPQSGAAATANGAPQAAVALHVGAQPVPPAAQVASAGTEADAESDAPAPAPKSSDVALDRAAVRPVSVDTPRPAELATAAAPVPTVSAPAIPASASALPAAQPDTLQELTRIVDSLAAAREAFAPAVEALAIEHAEFGELSLRFDQRRDGGLSVQLSASNPDAHRAVAQAVGAQPFQSAADDRTGSGQPQAQTASRGGPADREGAGGGGAARHEQSAPQQQRRAMPQQPQQGDRARHRAGVFA